MALMKCEVKQNNNDLGRTKLALKTDSLCIANLVLLFVWENGGFTDGLYKERAS